MEPQPRRDEIDAPDRSDKPAELLLSLQRPVEQLFLVAVRHRRAQRSEELRGLGVAARHRASGFLTIHVVGPPDRGCPDGRRRLQLLRVQNSTPAT